VKRDLDELLSAWADDPRALSAEERAEVAARVDDSPALQREADDTRALLGKLRDLPDAGEEPAWDGFERALRDRLDAERPGPVRRWLARWWRPALGLGLAAAAATVVIVANHQAPPAPSPTATRTIDAGVTPIATTLDVPSPPLERDDHDDDDAPFAFGAGGEIPADELDDRVVAALGADEDMNLDGDAQPEDGLVPDLSLDWIDELDDDQIDRVDQWLAVK
jgi:hypothetical protein